MKRIILSISIVLTPPASAAGGMALPGLAYGQTTFLLQHRIGSQLESKARTIILRDRIIRRKIHPVSGGAPIEEGEQLQLLIESQTDIRDKQTTPDGIVNDFIENHIHDYDPEYAQILSDIDRKHSLYKLTHRDLQWQTVAVVMQGLDNDERVELIKHVRRYPLHRRLPATVAISPRALGHWQKARKMFLDAVKESDPVS